MQALPREPVGELRGKAWRRPLSAEAFRRGSGRAGDRDDIAALARYAERYLYFAGLLGKLGRIGEMRVVGVRHDAVHTLGGGPPGAQQVLRRRAEDEQVE